MSSRRRSYSRGGWRRRSEDNYSSDGSADSFDSRDTYDRQKQVLGYAPTASPPNIKDAKAKVKTKNELYKKDGSRRDPEYSRWPSRTPSPEEKKKACFIFREH